MKRNSLGTYFLLTFAITWLFTIPFVVLWHTTMNQSLQWWAIFFLPGAYGPTIAALIVVGRTGGSAAVRRLLARLIEWRVRPRWYVFALLVPPGVVACAILISDFRWQAIQNFNLMPGLAFAPLALLLAAPFGPLAEELGWRGYALPKLMETQGLWKCSLLLGLVWTFWHLPMFWFPGAAIPSFLKPGAASIALYAAQVTAQAGLMTFLFTVTRGSVLLAVLYHASFNTAETIVFRMTSEPTVEIEFQIYVLSIVASWVLAAILLTIAPKTKSAEIHEESPRDQSGDQIP